MNPNPLAAANMVNQLFNAGDPDQYKRELVQNAIDAGATDIEAGAIRLAEFGEDGGVKAAFIDNGQGMSATKLADYIGELFNGASEVDAQGNYNMGGRVATLPFNPFGVIWASWVEGDPEGSFIHIAYNDEKRVYEIVSQAENGTVADDDRIGVPKPEWKHPTVEKAGHGTVVILLGSGIEDHTVGKIEPLEDGTFRYPSDRRPREDWQYYNTKFWKLPEHVTRLAFMFARQDLDAWKDHIAPGEFFHADEEHRVWRFRTWKGLDALLGDAESTGTLTVTSGRGYRARVYWGLFPENYKQAGGHPTDEALPLGLFGEKHRDELYALAYRSEGVAGSRGHVSFKLETYGIAHKEVKDRLAVVVEPLPNDDYMPATPAPSRHELRLANAPLPHQEWGEEFAMQMPTPIKERIDAVSGKTDSDLEKRLRDDQKKLASFFSRMILAWKDRGESAQVGDVTEGEGTSGKDPDTGGTPGESKKRSPGREGGQPSGARSNRKGPRIGGGVKHRENGPAVSNPNAVEPLEVRWDEYGSEFEDDYDGLLARWVPTSRLIWINGAHPYVKQLVHDAIRTRRASGEKESTTRVQNAIKTHLASQVTAIEMYRRTPAAGLRGRDSRFKDKALSDEALSAVLLNVLSMGTIIANTFRGSRTTAKIPAA
ncbi:MAG TPA: hypothetical protein VME67_03740 [Mycobacterium sp.]|nr:hypothetical protein [Mycobacterium sp.]HTX94015.1 hypothetical protein [Mycobacterium sp.]